MKRTYLVVFIAQTVLMLMFLVYALVQRTQVIKIKEISLQAANEAKQAQRLAEIARHELDECIKKK